MGTWRNLFSRYLGLDADGFYNPNPLLYPDFIAARDGLAVSSLVGGQRELFISWGNGADKTGILSVTDEEGTEVVRRSLDSENDYTLVENLVPGTTYHVALLKSDDAVLWKDDVKTKSVTGKFPLLKYQQVDGYMLVQLLNLPDDVSSYKVKLDGQEINIVNKNLNGQILTAEVTYKDGSVEMLSTTIRK